MLRAAAVARRFTTFAPPFSFPAESLLSSFPNPHLIPTEAFLQLPHTGFWRGLYHMFQENTLVKATQDFIVATSANGWGLGAGIVVFSLTFRGLFAPFILYTQICSVKMNMLGPEMAIHRDAINKAYSAGKRSEVMKAQEEMAALKRRFGIRTSYQLMQLTQVPFLIMFFWTVQDMTYDIIKYPGMLTDGFLWFPNLAEPDPYFLLPLALATSTFMSIHVFAT